MNLLHKIELEIANERTMPPATDDGLFPRTPQGGGKSLNSFIPRTPLSVARNRLTVGNEDKR